jgi:hypothetical protein
VQSSTRIFLVNGEADLEVTVNDFTSEGEVPLVALMLNVPIIVGTYLLLIAVLLFNKRLHVEVISLPLLSVTVIFT